MARNRMIKPEFWSSATLARLSRDSRLLFIGLWCFADDFGYCLHCARRILGDVFPTDNNVMQSDVVNWLLELQGAKLISVGMLDGKEILRINGWNEHQKVDKPSSRTWVPAQRTEEFEATIQTKNENSRDPRETLARPSRPKEKEKEKEKGKEKKKDIAVATFACLVEKYPDLNNSEFIGAYQSWIGHRAELKKRLTPTTIYRQLLECAIKGPQRAIEAINHSIEKGYTGIYEKAPYGPAIGQQGQLSPREIRAQSEYPEPKSEIPTI